MFSFTITPSFTFPYSGGCILRYGATPVDKARLCSLLLGVLCLMGVRLFLFRLTETAHKFCVRWFRFIWCLTASEPSPNSPFNLFSLSCSNILRFLSLILSNLLLYSSRAGCSCSSSLVAGRFECAFRFVSKGLESLEGAIFAV